MKSDLDVRLDPETGMLSVIKRTSSFEKTKTVVKQKPLCWYWTKGICKHSEGCRFRHELAQQEQVFGVEEMEGELCWYWERNQCKKGEKCIFRHYLNEKEIRDRTGAFGFNM